MMWVTNKVLKLIRILKQTFYYSRVKRFNTYSASIKKVGVLVKISKESKKFKLWHDGFTAAINKLKTDFDVDILFFDNQSQNELIDLINEYDFIIVKSGWRTEMDLFLRMNRKLLSPRLGLMISSSNYSPSKQEQQFYDVVWYETNWYKSRAVRHPNAYHGFGIDREVMKKIDQPKVYDWISVGAPRKYKRMEKLLTKNGKKLFVGDLTNSDKHSSSLLEKLKQNDIKIQDFHSYEDLALLYNQSKACYVPCKLHGGGERSVLEARACGLKVEVENDNEKIQELLDSPIWDAEYYYRQLLIGINSTNL